MFSVNKIANMKPIKLLLVAILVIGFSALAISNLVSSNNKLKLRDIQLESTSTKLKQLEIERKDLNKQLEAEVNQKVINEQKVQELEKKSLEQDTKQKELEAQLQAKLDAKKQTFPSVTPKAYAAVQVTGDKESWLRASGIPESEWWAVDSIVSRESGWKPCAYNPGRNDCSAMPTSACGLAQALPCSKLGPNWTDPVHNLKWQYNYVKARYGGYPQAVAFWNANHWY